LGEGGLSNILKKTFNLLNAKPVFYR